MLLNLCFKISDESMCSLNASDLKGTIFPSMRCLLESSSLPANSETRTLEPNRGSVSCFTLGFHHSSEKWGLDVFLALRGSKKNDHGNQK